MCCLPWLSALFGHLGWYSSEVSPQPLSQEPRGGNRTDDEKGYQQLQSMQSLPQSTNEQGKHGVFVTLFRRQLGSPSFACATVVIEVWQDGVRVAWKHAFVEQLFLIPDGKQALESFLCRELDEGEIRQVYESILMQAQPDWKSRGDKSLNGLWRSISMQRSHGKLDGLINRVVQIQT